MNHLKKLYGCSNLEKIFDKILFVEMIIWFGAGQNKKKKNEFGHLGLT